MNSRRGCRGVDTKELFRSTSRCPSPILTGGQIGPDAVRLVRKVDLSVMADHGEYRIAHDRACIDQDILRLQIGELQVVVDAIRLHGAVDERGRIRRLEQDRAVRSVNLQAGGAVRQSDFSRLREHVGKARETVGAAGKFDDILARVEIDNCIVAVARIENESILAGSANEGIVAAAAVDLVVTGDTVDDIVVLIAVQVIVILGPNDNLNRLQIGDRRPRSGIQRAASRPGLGIICGILEIDPDRPCQIAEIRGICSAAAPQVVVRPRINERIVAGAALQPAVAGT